MADEQMCRPTLVSFLFHMRAMNVNVVRHKRLCYVHNPHIEYTKSNTPMAIRNNFHLVMKGKVAALMHATPTKNACTTRYT